VFDNYTPIKLSIQREMQKLCELCGESLEDGRRIDNCDGLNHVECIERWYAGCCERAGMPT
jgi:hypothetical protein